MTARQAAAAAAAIVAAAVAVTACGSGSGAGLGPPTSTTAAAVEQASQPSPREVARRFTVRVRSITCEGVGTASGFMAGPDILVTNRHVVEGAYHLDVETWDGRTLSLGVAGQATLADLGVVQVTGAAPPAPELAASAPPRGAAVFAAGYPEGGRFRLTRGEVVDLSRNLALGNAGGTLRITSEVQPGNSGGPLFDASGRVVGVVYAIELATGYGLAVPVQTLRTALSTRGLFRAVRPCD